MRTTDEINAMTVPELRAAVAVDLLGWEMRTHTRQGKTYSAIYAPSDDYYRSMLTADSEALDFGVAMRMDRLDGWDFNFVRWMEKEASKHPGGWLGVVDDAMIARPEQWQPMHRVIQVFRGPRWFAGYVRARDGALICYEHADRETATLRAVLLALAAEAAAAASNAFDLVIDAARNAKRNREAEQGDGPSAEAAEKGGNA